MTPQEKEAFYDKEVAPVLGKLAQKCIDNGLNLFALVEWDPEGQLANEQPSYGRTMGCAGTLGPTVRACNDLAKKGFTAFAVDKANNKIYQT